MAAPPARRAFVTGLHFSWASFQTSTWAVPAAGPEWSVTVIRRVPSAAATEVTASRRRAQIDVRMTVLYGAVAP